jgi:hypothetical protein
LFYATFCLTQNFVWRKILFDATFCLTQNFVWRNIFCCLRTKAW